MAIDPVTNFMYIFSCVYEMVGYTCPVNKVVRWDSFNEPYYPDLFSYNPGKSAAYWMLPIVSSLATTKLTYLRVNLGLTFSNTRNIEMTISGFTPTHARDMMYKSATEISALN